MWMCQISNVAVPTPPPPLQRENMVWTSKGTHAVCLISYSDSKKTALIRSCGTRTRLRSCVYIIAIFFLLNMLWYITSKTWGKAKWTMIIIKKCYMWTQTAHLSHPIEVQKIECINQITTTIKLVNSTMLTHARTHAHSNEEDREHRTLDTLTTCERRLSWQDFGHECRIRRRSAKNWNFNLLMRN